MRFILVKCRGTNPNEWRATCATDNSTVDLFISDDTLTTITQVKAYIRTLFPTATFYDEDQTHAV